MGNFDKPVFRRDDPPPFEKIVVSPIEKDKKSKEEAYKGLKNSTKSQVLATLVSYFKKLITTFSGQEEFTDHQLINAITAFQKLLLILSAEDQSHNPDFTEQLTETWHQLNDNCNALTFTSQPPSEFLNKLKFFITQVKNYPPGADHTLGYYFHEYAGKDWIPFPFMGLLQHLHIEHQNNAILSTLNNWLYLLDEIVQEFKEH